MNSAKRFYNWSNAPFGTSPINKSDEIVSVIWCWPIECIWMCRLSPKYGQNDAKLHIRWGRPITIIIAWFQCLSLFKYATSASFDCVCGQCVCNFEYSVYGKIWRFHAIWNMFSCGQTTCEHNSKRSNGMIPSEFTPITINTYVNKMECVSNLTISTAIQYTCWLILHYIYLETIQILLPNQPNMDFLCCLKTWPIFNSLYDEKMFESKCWSTTMFRIQWKDFSTFYELACTPEHLRDSCQTFSAPRLFF